MNISPSKDALVDWDTLKADQAAYGSPEKADSLPLRMLKADSSYRPDGESLAASIDAGGKRTDWRDGYRRQAAFIQYVDRMNYITWCGRFGMMGKSIYHIRCPMAFGDSSEGFWLSNTSAIINPYLGKSIRYFKAKMIGMRGDHRFTGFRRNSRA